jgi:YD repeat-containing protein
VKQSWLKKSIIRLFLVLILLMVGVITLQAGQASYLYDPLGRLVSVTDGQGNMAVYNYDPVGNLLSIQKFTASPTGIGIFLLLPPEGTVGTQVEIRGYGFDPVASNNQVQFNGTAATVISSTANLIITSVPPNATTGPVTITNANGIAASPNSFTVLQLPFITGISPNLVAQGTKNINTIITGFNLMGARSISFIQPGITVAILSGGSSTQILINLNIASSVPIGSYPFSVTTPAGTNQSGTVTVLVSPPNPDSSTANPLSVFMPSPGQAHPTGPESVITSALSVFMAPLANLSPSGLESIGVAPLSVFLPSPLNLTPSGQESTTTFPLSIYFPAPGMVSPSGSMTVVGPPESISMP